MKIGLVIDDTLDTSDGVQQYLTLIGQWFSDHSHEVHYLTTKSTRKDIDNVHSLGRHLRVPFNKNVVPFVLPSSAKLISELLTREQFDVLHIQMPYNPAFGARVIDLAPRHTAVVGTFHILPYSKTEKRLSKALSYWLKNSSSRFDKVISVSRPAQEFAHETFKLDSVVIPNTVDVRSYKVANKLSFSNPPNIVFVGRLVPRKGCQHFLNSLSLVSSEFKAIIVGDGPERQSLEKLSRKLSLDTKVTFKGFVSEKEKQSILHKADIAVFPSTSGESFGIVLIEAMASGSCIVLGGDNPGYSSVLSDCSESLFSPTNHQQLAHLIDRCIVDEKFADSLYKKQQELVKRFDIDIVGQQLLDTYKQAIDIRRKKLHTKV